MDVEGLSKILRAHGGALDMPARSAWPPRAFPTRFPRLARFPQCKIQRRLLALIDFHPCAGFQLIDLFARELPIAFKSLYRVKDIPIDVRGKSLLFEPLYQGDNLRNVQCRPRLLSWRK